MNIDGFQLEQSKIISEAFAKFNKTLLDFRKFQQSLEKKIEDLQSELSLKNQELNNVLQSLPNGLIVTDKNFKIISFNRSAATITGIDEEKAKKIGVNNLLGIILLPSSPDKILKSITPTSINQTFDYIRPDGSISYLQANVSLMSSANQKQADGIIINLQDITLLRNLQQEADRKNKLAAMGQIAAGVAHEIRNPLGGIELFVSMLKKDLAESEHIEVLEHIQSGIRSMNHIISNILEYTKPQDVNFKQVDLLDLVDNFAKFNHLHALHHNIDIIIDFKLKEALLWGNSEQLKQMLQNLYMNALQAMHNGGKIKFKVLKNKAKSTKIKKKNIAKPQSLLELQVIDEGEGMTLVTQNKIFNPFYTTKAKGTGLGLSIVKQIIESHQGTISIKSEKQKGTTIFITFPASKLN